MEFLVENFYYVLFVVRVRVCAIFILRGSFDRVAWDICATIYFREILPSTIWQQNEVLILLARGFDLDVVLF